MLHEVEGSLSTTTAASPELGLCRVLTIRYALGAADVLEPPQADNPRPGPVEQTFPQEKP